ncbi:MAG: PEP-CTERM sorting domain-containing protein [Planctomycetota bacterium]
MNSPLNPVPEPSTLALLVAGVVVGFGAWRRRRK